MGKRIKKHLFARILEQSKQTNQRFLYVQKSTDNCYLIPVDNKNSIFIPEQREGRLNPFFENNKRFSAEGKICGVTSSTKYELSLVYYSVLSLSFSFALLSFLF